MKKNLLPFRRYACSSPFRKDEQSQPFNPCNSKKIIRALVFLCFSPFLSIAQQWQTLGNSADIATAASNYTSIATTLDGAATLTYIAFTEDNIAKARKFDGTSWEAVGGNISSGNATFTKINADENGKLYVSYVDAANGNKLAVKTFNTADSVWQPLNNDPANLYLSNGTVTNSLGQYSSSSRSSLAFDSNDVPYVIYGEGSALIPTVKRFNGTSWELVGNAAVSSQRAVGVSIAIDDTNTPYIVFANQATATSTTGNLVMYRFVNSTWESIAVPAPIPGGSSITGNPGAIRHTAITFNQAWNPVVSYFNASNSNRTTVIIYNKTSGVWAFSSTISGRDITHNGLTRDDAGNVYSSFIDVVSAGSGRVVARLFKLPAGSTTWAEVKNADVAQGIDEPASNVSISADKNNIPYAVYTKTANGIATPVVKVFQPGTPPPPPPPPVPPTPDPVVSLPRMVEKLGRGLVAVRTATNRVYVGWRLLGTDPKTIAFNLYRDGVKVNQQPITNSTNYTDTTTLTGKYAVKPLVNGVEQKTSAAVSAWDKQYLEINLQVPPPGVTPSGEAYTYSPNDTSPGDLDGDGEYDVVVLWNPSNAKDNSQSGYTGNVYIDGYKLDGTRLWRIDLGRNIRAGAHYTQLMVYDLDGDGKAEIAVKTADGTVSGTGQVIGNAAADYRNSGGYILTGPEFLTVFNGQTGAALATKDFIPARGVVSSWGDNYGNRVDRFISTIAYVDGSRPTLIMGRGYYTRMVRAAWDYREGALTNRWTFDSNTAGNSTYYGQGNHQLSVADGDGDGKQEIYNGSSAINDNGKGLYANGLGHGDALHVGDIDPDRPGQEVWMCHEEATRTGIGLSLTDAKTGAIIWSVPGTGDIGRAMASDIDPRYKGMEVWGATGGLYTSTGTLITNTKPSFNFGLWWDGDLQRELLDGTKLDKWNSTTNSVNRLYTFYLQGTATQINGTKANPNFSADILGDWREEAIFHSSDNTKLLIFTTIIPAENRFYTFMHDAQYRVQVAGQTSAYNQPPHTSFYFGGGMDSIPTPKLIYPADIVPPVALARNITVTLVNGEATVSAQQVDNGSYDMYDIASLALSKSSFNCSNIGENAVVLTVTDASGNVSTANAVVNVIGSLPVAPSIAVSRADNTVTGTDANTIVLGYGAQELTLTASAGEAVSYQWSPAAGLSNLNTAVTLFKPTVAGTYVFAVTGTNEFGCTAGSSVTITVIDARCGNKILVCHKGNTLCIASPAVKAHLAHGCSLGTCTTGNQKLALISSSNEAVNLVENAASLIIYPNPVSTQSKVEFRLTEAGKYEVGVYSMSGTLMEVIGKGNAKDAGAISVPLNVQKYTSGVYVVRLITAKETISKQILVP